MNEFFKKNPIVKDAMILTVITLVAGVALGLVYEVTKAPIAQAQEAAKQAAYAEVFTTADHFEEAEGFDADAATKLVQGEGYTDDEITECLEARGTDDGLLGYVITVVSHAGYGGNITFSVGVTQDGMLNGYSITDISETAGLGMKSTEEEFMSQFKDIPAALLEVVKSDAAENEIQAISGATITSKAVTYGVNAAIVYAESLGAGGETSE